VEACFRNDNSGDREIMAIQSMGGSMTHAFESGGATDGAAGSRSPMILVATDGESQSRGALAAGSAMASRLDARVQVLTVNWFKGFIMPEAPLMVDPSLEAARRAGLLRRARAQTEPYTKTGAFESAEVRDGDPAQVVANVAAERHALFIIAGLGKHQIVDRLFRDETALRLIRVSRAPVLAVPESFPPDFSQSPRRAIVAMDFSEGSARAAQAALALLPPRSTVELVHVRPREQDLGYALIPVEEYQRSVAFNFSLLRRRLVVPDGACIQERVLAGNPAVELLALAADTHADLIAAGSHGYGFLARMVIGSVATKLLRGASCGVLVVPPDAAPDTLGCELRAVDDIDVDQQAYA
jgi:nucleotide-binding universal stress UspA family protein